jgi:hypothetical protein
MNPDDDLLESRLREQGYREAYIEDGGFTAVVMARLPAPPNLAPRRWILLASALAAGVCGLALFGGAAFIWQATLDLVRLRGFGSAQISVLVFALLFYWSLYAVVNAETA